jgi:hypothetical protein
VSDRERLEELEKQHQAQLLGLGGLALEMHQRDELDEAKLMAAASEAAETERELARLLGVTDEIEAQQPEASA